MIGAFVVWVIHNIPCHFFKTGILLLPIAWILLIIVLGMAAINGASRWIDLGFIQFQPSELAKMATIITVAFILSKMQEEGISTESIYVDPKASTSVSCVIANTSNWLSAYFCSCL